MPVMDGLEFVRQLQTMEKLRGVPVVMITTEGSESNVVQALSLGAKGYIRKPFTPDQVNEHVLPAHAMQHRTLVQRCWISPTSRPSAVASARTRPAPAGRLQSESGRTVPEPGAEFPSGHPRRELAACLSQRAKDVFTRRKCPGPPNLQFLSNYLRRSAPGRMG
jgi:CheY-like chemotaxis protein